jgi:predicted dehydrogenase
MRIFMKTISVIGLGNRGTEYMGFVKWFHRKEAKIVALCDISQQALDDYSSKYKIPKEMQFLSTQEFFGRGVLSDGLIISVQDKEHYAITKAAIETGYKTILLEKPVSDNIDECIELRDMARANGVLLVVCHVLRYSNYYGKIKELIRSGVIGDIISINHTENVGYFHFAHSFVRGNWRSKEESTPAIFAKTCHDLDLISWFMESNCTSVSSIGALNYFKKENAPQGATPTCLGGCKAKGSCPYDAERLYIKDPFWRATFIKYLKRTLTGKAKNTKEDIYNALRNGNYGRCVYLCDNDVVDNQVVTMTFENGANAVMELNAFSHKMHRETHVMGTKGELIGYDKKLSMCEFGKRPKRVHIGGSVHLSGHIEGDIRIVSSFVKLLTGEITDLKDITTIENTIPSHEMARMAEISRKNGGEVVRAERVR